jgi:uracil-DNA glycosylase
MTDKNGKKEALRKLFRKSHEGKMCRSIDIAKNRTFVSDLGHGNPNADLFFIGEAPGKDEDDQGIPFVGQAGKLFDENLRKVGLSRDDVWVSNIVKFRPTKDNGSRNRAPRKHERESCLPLLKREIEIVDPKVLIPMGNTAYSSLTGKNDPISDVVAKPTKWNERWIFPLYHPAYAIYNREVREDMTDHIQKLKDFARCP